MRIDILCWAILLVRCAGATGHEGESSVSHSHAADFLTACKSAPATGQASPYGVVRSVYMNHACHVAYYRGGTRAAWVDECREKSATFHCANVAVKRTQSWAPAAS